MHICTLHMYQQLKGICEEISESDFTTLILASLPKSYRPLINTISLQNRVNTSKPLKPSTAPIPMYVVLANKPRRLS